MVWSAVISTLSAAGRHRNSLRASWQSHGSATLKGIRDNDKVTDLSFSRHRCDHGAGFEFHGFLSPAYQRSVVLLRLQ